MLKTFFTIGAMLAVMAGSAAAATVGDNIFINAASPSFNVSVNSGSNTAYLVWTKGLGTNSGIQNANNSKYIAQNATFCSDGSFTETSTVPAPNTNQFCVYFPINTDAGKAMLSTALTAKAMGSYLSMYFAYNPTTIKAGQGYPIWFLAATGAM